MSEKNFTITENAVNRIKHLLQNEPDNTVLRISVEAGGCSGFRYKYDLIPDDRNNDDIVLKEKEVVILIDKMSMEFLLKSRLDYIEDLGSAYFEIQNPQASSKCGCGNSFAV